MKPNKFYLLFDKSMHTLEIKADFYPLDDSFLKQHGFHFNKRTKSYTMKDDDDIGPDLVAYPYMMQLGHELSLLYKSDVEQKDV